ncbi:MAG: hypothetical protein A3H27_00440 [Acidobacteria bacterium RIFCSPLOWO2_02_FULL_59_13]|nr:MAG: hypothetical protein A3H27_00440 [Acidobacteria bacterium RIFCSPLOWO2_02_FULL_59_13]
MFKYVHHVHYIVRDLDEMVKYLEKNFGHRPDHQANYGDHDIKAIYGVGKTTIEISQPLDPDSNQGKVLAAKGPGIYHVAWAVDNIRQVAEDLAARGNDLGGGDGVKDSPHGYHTVNIDPDSSLGVWFQLAEGESRARHQGEGRQMGVFQYVQQVEYNVKNRDEMVAYIERNFGMKPDALEENVRGEWVEAQYCIEETLLRIREPVPGTGTAKRFIEKYGPGVRLVAWGTTYNIADVAKKLKANGNILKDKQRGFHQSSQGTEQIDIDPESSLGVLFQIIERPR